MKINMRTDYRIVDNLSRDGKLFAPLAHFALTSADGAAAHRAHNELHALYHWPELQSQPGVAWGERWVRDPACAAAGTKPAEGFDADYCAMYWLRAPALASAQAFEAHFARAAHLGMAETPPRFAGYMVPLKGYVRREPLVSDQALPFRPNKGIYLIVSRFRCHHDVESEDVFRWYDQVRIPDMLDCPGAAGAWTFSARSLYSPTRDLSQPAIRIQLFYLDGDPVAFADAVREAEGGWRKAGRSRDTSAVEDLLFAGPLRAIVPWRWNWFDGETGGAR